MSDTQNNNKGENDAVQIKAAGVEGSFLLSGMLTFETVPSVLSSSSTLFGGGADFTFDLQGITHADSAGLALLIEWMRCVRAQEKHITFKNIPSQMLAIATISGVEHILPTA